MGIYILIAIGFASAIYLLIYAWRHPPEQEIKQKTSIRADLPMYYDIIKKLDEIKNDITDLRNQLSKNGLIK
ncbi:hypothetical protein FJZ31_20500 [Candidatus Poribacteria bacterium]|nr:hypothetical protein [Candidatus Poribacteria bacterium]